uniref:ABC transporter A family member 1 n=1 Tax=Lygus hesperus TaxID=30085 RepID=A0A0A9YQ97_LYGHE
MIVLSFLFPVSQMTKRVVIEKELRIREAMLIMGVSESVMYSAWLIIYAIQFLFVSLVMTIILAVTSLKGCNFGFIFLSIYFFTLSTITLSGLIATFFTKARLASMLAPLIYFLLAIPLFTLNNANSATKSSILVLSPSALSVSFSIMF